MPYRNQILYIDQTWYAFFKSVEKSKENLIKWEQ